MYLRQSRGLICDQPKADWPANQRRISIRCIYLLSLDGRGLIPLEPIILMFTRVEALETAPGIVKLYESPGKAGGVPVID
jgi:hypothetical protein